jgi:alpha-beta hydrolase superfamily lysophospholipase
VTAAVAIEAGEEGPGFRFETWRFTGHRGDPVAAEVALPETTPAWGAVLVAHGATGDRRAEYVRGAGKHWARHGLITAAPDLPLHGDRGPGILQPSHLGDAALLEQAVGDLGTLADLISNDRRTSDLPLGFLGFSMGALAGPAYVASDPRVRAVVLALAGSTKVLAEQRLPDLAGLFGRALDATDPISNAPGLGERPVLMLNADQDEIFSREAAFALYEVLPGPKEIVFFPGTHAVWAQPGRRYRLMYEFFLYQLRCE